jgi:hypothetical protein
VPQLAELVAHPFQDLHQELRDAARLRRPPECVAHPAAEIVRGQDQLHREPVEQRRHIFLVNCRLDALDSCAQPHEVSVFLEKGIDERPILQPDGSQAFQHARR